MARQFPRLPSIHELLNHPAVERVIERVNQTTIAQRATGFLEEIQSGIRHKAEHGFIPSLNQLAERFARRLMGRDHVSVPLLNATGIVWGTTWRWPPLPDSAVEEIAHFACEYSDNEFPWMWKVEDALQSLTGASAAWVAVSHEAAVDQLTRLGITQFDALRYRGIVNPAAFGFPPVPSISERLQAGGELLVVDGAGLVGGPPCGIVLGHREKIEQLRADSGASLAAAPPLVLAALSSTLQIYRNVEQPEFQIPILQLLAAPLENLRQRCERIAPLVAEAAVVAEAQPLECQSLWLDTVEVKQSAPSWAIRVTPAENAANTFSQLCAQSYPVIVPRLEGDSIWLDFRSIFPRWDQQLAAALQPAEQES